MATLDFSTARLKHTNWKLKLRAFLDGKESLTEAQATSPKDCELGKWLYSEGLAKYSGFPEMKQLEKAHSELHASVRHIVSAKKLGNTHGAEEEFKKVGSTSDSIVALLTAIEKKVNG